MHGVELRAGFAESAALTCQRRVDVDCVVTTTIAPLQECFPVLMLALPHHLPQLPADVAAAARGSPLSYNTIKGDMLPVVGDTGHLTDHVEPLRWGAPRPIAPERLAAVTEALRAEKSKPMLAIDPCAAAPPCARARA